MTVLWSASLGTDAVVLWPTTYTETDTAPGSGLTCVKSISINFADLPNDVDPLFLLFTAGQFNNIGSKVCEIWVGGTATGHDGTQLWSSGNGSTSGFVDINTHVVGHKNNPPNFFANPSPSGTSYLKLFASGSGGGFRNFTIEIHHGPIGLVDGAGTFKTLSPPFEDWGAQDLTVTISGTFRNGSSWGINQRMEARALTTVGDVEFGSMGILPDGSSQAMSTTYAALTFEDYGNYGGAVHDLVGTFASTGVAGRIELSVPFDYISTAALTALLKDAIITIEGSPSLSVAVTAPPADEALEPTTELEFVVENDGLPATLTATVTLADGTQEIAWDFDQTTAGYDGSLDVVGTTRTYRISRKKKWPVGPLSIEVEVT